MRNMTTCLKCKSQDITGPHRLHTGDGHHLSIDLPGWSSATLEAFTCNNCGYTELYPDVKGMQNLRSSGRKY